MKLIIDIPKGEYDKICLTMLHTSSGNPNFYFESKIANGTPIPDNATVCDLGTIVAEILDAFLWDGQTEEDLNDSVKRCLRIIGKYMAESEEKK